MALLDSPFIQQMVQENIEIGQEMQDAITRLTQEGNVADAQIVQQLLDENKKIRTAVLENDVSQAIGACFRCGEIIDSYPELFQRIESWNQRTAEDPSVS